MNDLDVLPVQEVQGCERVTKGVEADPLDTRPLKDGMKVSLRGGGRVEGLASFVANTR